MITILLDKNKIEWQKIDEYYSEKSIAITRNKDYFSINHHSVMFWNKADADEFFDLFGHMRLRMTVFIDLDGVLADFKSKVCEINGINNEEYENLTRNEMWRSIEDYDSNVEPFFESLELMEDALELLEFVKNNFSNVYILTATGTTPEPKTCSAQKIRWVRRVLGDYIIPITVQQSEYKALYATKSSILIDDSTRSIEPWREAGGVGILHVSAKDTIEKLKEHC